MQANTATERQIKLIEDLYAELRIRNTALYGGAAPAQLTKQTASEVIDVLMLRKVSSELHRPVTADLTDPAQVREQLARLEQLIDHHHKRHAAATAKRTEHLRKASAISDIAERQSQAAEAPRVRVLPHLSNHQQAERRELSEEQLAARAAELDREKDARLDAASRYSDVTGYGSSASYQADVRPASNAPQLTDDQERKIIELQVAGDDASVVNTVAEANEYLDQAFAPREPLAPTERQLAYLHRLERAAGKTDEELSRPGTRQGASRRIQNYLAGASRSSSTAAHADLAAAVALTAVASPQPHGEVAMPTDGDSGEHKSTHRLLGSSYPRGCSER